MKRLFRILIISVIAVFVFVSCNLSGSESTDSNGISLYVTGNTEDSSTAGSRNANASQGVTTELGGSKIVVTKVEMVILELKLDVDSDNPDSVVEDLEVGPFLFDLPLDGSVAKLFDGIFVPEAYYDELEIEVDAPEGDDEHVAFFEATYPDWPIHASIRVTGTYQSGDADPIDFVYVQEDFNDDFEIEFEPALQISDGETSIVLAIDVSAWFLNETADGLYNPNDITPDSDAASQVEDNIENSFEAFEDSLEN